MRCASLCIGKMEVRIYPNVHRSQVRISPNIRAPYQAREKRTLWETQVPPLGSIGKAAYIEVNSLISMHRQNRHVFGHFCVSGCSSRRASLYRFRVLCCRTRLNTILVHPGTVGRPALPQFIRYSVCENARVSPSPHIFPLTSPGFPR